MVVLAHPVAHVPVEIAVDQNAAAQKGAQRDALRVIVTAIAVCVVQTII